MLHEAYLQHLQTYFLSAYEDRQFWKTLENYAKELIILAQLNLDPARELLESLYSPVKRSPPRDPTEMFRSLILMTLLKTAGITKWVKQTRSLPFFSVFAGFLPDDTPGVGTYYDFLKRIINGPLPEALLPLGPANPLPYRTPSEKFRFGKDRPKGPR